MTWAFDIDFVFACEWGNWSASFARSVALGPRGKTIREPRVVLRSAEHHAIRRRLVSNKACLHAASGKLGAAWFSSKRF